MNEMKELEELLHKGFRFALSLTHSEPGAEDLVQEAWIKLHSKGKTINKPLLFTTIRNLFIDQYRRNKFVVLGSDDVLANMGEEPDYIDYYNVDDKTLNNALSELRVEEREALFLNVVEGFSAAQIGKMSNRPRGSILSLLHRAKQKLNKLLTAQDTKVKVGESR